MSRAEWIKGSLCLSGAAAIWGGMYVVSSAVLAVIPPWTLLEMRFVLSLLVLGVVAAVRRAWRVSRTDMWLLAVIGLVGYAMSIGMQFIGTKLSGTNGNRVGERLRRSVRGRAGCPGLQPPASTNGLTRTSYAG